MKKIFYMISVIVMLQSCAGRGTQEQAPVEELTAWQQDSLYRIELEVADHSDVDSLLTSLLGEPSKCLSYLRDYYQVGESRWYVNVSFGMSLQLPDGFVPDECTNLDMVSHGAKITSADSPIEILVTAWYDVIEPEDREEILRQEREEHPDDYFRQVVTQGVEYTLRVIHGKGTEKEFKKMLPYLERFPEGPHGLLTVD